MPQHQVSKSTLRPLEVWLISFCTLQKYLENHNFLISFNTGKLLLKFFTFITLLYLKLFSSCFLVLFLLILSSSLKVVLPASWTPLLSTLQKYYCLVFLPFDQHLGHQLSNTKLQSFLKTNHSNKLLPTLHNQ